MSFPGSADGKESACNVGNLGLIPGLGKSPREGKGYPLQYSCSMDRGVWRAPVHGAQKVRHDSVTNTFTSLQFCGLVHDLSCRMSLMHLEKKMYSAVFGYSGLWMSIKSNSSIIII